TPEVDILVPGYSNHASIGIMEAWPNVVLIRDGSDNIIIDPGSVIDFSVITDALARFDLGIKDITAVGATHYHMDHFRYIGAFPCARVIDRNTFTVGDRHYILRKGKISHNVKMVKTPGHTPDSVTFFVENTRDGVIAVCGDIFVRDSDFSDDFSIHSDPALNRESGLYVMNNAHRIIPGHTPMFEGLKVA
ncbi:MAG: MBL fold metallo-hydrolase, partial [Candidatus Gracilibacteria bacterium]